MFKIFLFLSLSYLSADIIPYNSQTAINSAGAVVSVWQSYDTNLSTTTIMAAYSPDGTSWGSSQSISQTDLTCTGPSLLIDRNGNAVAVWFAIDPESSVSSIYAAMYNAGSGLWNPYELIGSSNDLFSLKMNDNSTIALTFTNSAVGPSAINVTTATCGTSGWSTPFNLSSSFKIRH